MMRNISYLLLIMVLIISCDFADKKLSFINNNDTNVIVESVFYKNKDAEGVPCTRNLVRANSKQTLELLNRKWKMYFNGNEEDCFLEFKIVEAPESIINPEDHIHEYLEQNLSIGNYTKMNFTSDQLRLLDWEIEYPK